jgi:hypothetical protein
MKNHIFVAHNSKVTLKTSEPTAKSFQAFKLSGLSIVYLNYKPAIIELYYIVFSSSIMNCEKLRD